MLAKYAFARRPLTTRSTYSPAPFVLVDACCALHRHARAGSLSRSGLPACLCAKHAPGVPGRGLQSSSSAAVQRLRTRTRTRARARHKSRLRSRSARPLVVALVATRVHHSGCPAHVAYQLLGYSLRAVACSTLSLTRSAGSSNLQLASVLRTPGCAYLARFKACFASYFGHARDRRSLRNLARSQACLLTRCPRGRTGRDLRSTQRSATTLLRSFCCAVLRT